MPILHRGTRPRRLGRWVTAAALAVVALGVAVASASGDGFPFFDGGSPVLYPGNLLISRSVYQPVSITTGATGATGVTDLPPDCVTGCAAAVANGTYPYVWNNDLADASFGVTSPIFIDQVNPYSGHLVNTIPVPTSELVTSFSSKSEMALNLSTNGRFVTFMGYVALPGTLDVSNANTPGEVDPTNPVTGAYYRAVATLDADGHLHYTETNAYSGDNGRAAILADSGPGDPTLFTAGNAGNGSNPQPPAVILGAGAQGFAPSISPESFQSPGAPTPVGSFNITELPANAKTDKIGKDDNFRGLTIYDNVLYYTKGSGSNGINTVYFLDTTGSACHGGVGVPAPGAALPSGPLTGIPTSTATLETDGLPSNMCILKGFPTTLAKTSTAFPFGVWFANPHTLYVADEGNGTATYSSSTKTYTAAAAQTSAGLQKWVFNSATGAWQLAYTLTSGLKLGQPYSVATGPAGPYPTGDNAADSPPTPWAPATDGLRNITGRVNPNGTATIWAVTSTVSGDGDQGADPNKVVAITDNLDGATLPASESFTTIDAATSGEVLRGVSLTPGTLTP